MPKRLSIQLMRQLAERRSGKCLSDIYVDANSKLNWQCAKGHRWRAIPSNIKRGHWCPLCAGHGKSIEDMKNAAADRGGRCLSEEYINARTHLLWQCKEGHQWRAIPVNITRKGSWCPVCAIKKRAQTRRKTRWVYTRSELAIDAPVTGHAHLHPG